MTPPKSRKPGPEPDPKNPYGDFEITDPKAMRALAHPVRLALLERLQRYGAATASQLSPHVGATPSVTSWHLRHLAGFGLVRDAESGPDRRERRWEAAARGFSFGTADSDAEGRAAARLLSDQMFLAASDLPLRWITETSPKLEPVWQDQSGLANTQIVATPEELDRINDALMNVLTPYVLRDPQEAPEGARAVRFLRYVLPEAAKADAGDDAAGADTDTNTGEAADGADSGE
jgi:DNA-binding transcriptional ArsR family regulator